MPIFDLLPDHDGVGGVVDVNISTPLPSGSNTIGAITGQGGAPLASESTIGKRFAGGKNTSATIISSIGNNIIYTPGTGKLLTLFWIFLSSRQDNTQEVVATVKLGSKIIYQCYMGNPGAFAHWEAISADNINDALIINLSTGSQNIAVNYTTTES